MPVVERSALLPFAAPQLLALVQDVAAYPAFLPGCTAARVVAEQGAVTEAELAFRLAGLNDQFATENTVSLAENGAQQLRMRLVRGPFKSLLGEWQFTPLGEAGCKVSLKVQLDFGPKLLQGLLGGQMEKAVSGVIAAFKARAEALYGRA